MSFILVDIVIAANAVDGVAGVVEAVIVIVAAVVIVDAAAVVIVVVAAAVIVVVVVTKVTQVELLPKQTMNGSNIEEKRSQKLISSE